MVGFLDAAEQVLRQEGQPLHYDEITSRAIAQGLITTQGQTPARTMNASINASIQRGQSPFERVARGIFGLAVWDKGVSGRGQDPQRGLEMGQMITNRTYWLDLFTGTTWQEFLDAGAETSGFREGRRKTVQRIRPGDYFLCYLTGVSRLIGALEVVSDPFCDDTPIWKDETFPWRFKVKIVVALKPETAVPITHLKDQLTIFQESDKPFAWTGYVRGSPSKWKASDGEAVLKALLEAKENPVVRPFDPAKLARRPPAFKAKIGPVTVPDSEEVEAPTTDTGDEPTLHAEIQWLLLKLGNDMGLDVWVARNDRHREVRGRRFADLPRLKEDLPLQFDQATNRTIELIDVLWLKGNAIVSAFEIESTTSIYSGLLRMADLISMQPNLNIPLYLVAPDERRQKVFAEVTRPTFSRLSPPLNQACKFIPISALKKRIPSIEYLSLYLKPEFLEELSEFCEITED